MRRRGPRRRHRAPAARARRDQPLVPRPARRVPEADRRGHGGEHLVQHARGADRVYAGRRGAGVPARPPRLPRDRVPSSSRTPRSARWWGGRRARARREGRGLRARLRRLGDRRRPGARRPSGRRLRPLAPEDRAAARGQGAGARARARGDRGAHPAGRNAARHRGPRGGAGRRRDLPDLRRHAEPPRRLARSRPRAPGGGADRLEALPRRRRPRGGGAQHRAPRQRARASCCRRWRAPPAAPPARAGSSAPTPSSCARAPRSRDYDQPNRILVGERVPGCGERVLGSLRGHRGRALPGAPRGGRGDQVHRQRLPRAEDHLRQRDRAGVGGPGRRRAGGDGDRGARPQAERVARLPAPGLRLRRELPAEGPARADLTPRARRACASRCSTPCWTRTTCS